MFIDPSNRSLGTQSCLHGYTYLVQDNEWNIIAEVRRRKKKILDFYFVVDVDVVVIDIVAVLNNHIQ
jgi:hypothetical protein